VQELAILIGVVVLLIAATAIFHGAIRPVLRVVELVMLGGSILTILVVMLFVCAEVVMRYAFNAPIPGHLEGSELLLPVIVFLAISYTQRTHGHVGMDLVLDAMPEAVRRTMQVVTYLVSIVVCAVLAWFTFKLAHQLWLYDDVTMTPPYFKTWPAAAAIPLGYAAIGVRMALQVLTLLAPDRFPDDTPPEPSVQLKDSEQPL
jgi:TRAP-type C4-dicarboxylate transport system permease small subunit